MTEPLTVPALRAPEEVDREFRMLIDGDWVVAESGETFSCVDPFHGGLVGAGADRRPGRRRPGRPVPPAAHSTRAAGGRRSPLREPRCSAGLAQLIEENADALTHRQIRENGKLMRPLANHRRWSSSMAFD